MNVVSTLRIRINGRWQTGDRAIGINSECSEGGPTQFALR